MRSDDLTTFLTSEGPPELGFRQGKVLAWDPFTAANTIEISGQPFTDLPIIAASSISLSVGDIVAVVRFQSTYLILGRINQVGNLHSWSAAAGMMGPADPQFNAWPSTVSGSFEDLWAGWIRRSSTYLLWNARTYVGPNTTGEFAFYVDGVQIAASGTYVGGASGAIGNFTTPGWPWPATTDWAGVKAVVLKARRISGAGKLAASMQSLSIT